MKKLAFKILFSLSSFSGIIMFLIINNIKDTNCVKNICWMIGKYSIIFFVIMGFAWLVLFLSKQFLENSDTLMVTEIKPIESKFIPIYIGLFIIAFKLNFSHSSETYFFIFFLFILWGFFERVAYFNPFFLFFGYRFYEVKSNKLTFMVITKKPDLKKIDKFNSLIRINNFTFLEYETK